MQLALELSFWVELARSLDSRHCRNDFRNFFIGFSHTVDALIVIAETFFNGFPFTDWTDKPFSLLFFVFIVHFSSASPLMSLKMFHPFLFSRLIAVIFHKLSHLPLHTIVSLWEISHRSTFSSSPARFFICQCLVGLNERKNESFTMIFIRLYSSSLLCLTSLFPFIPRFASTFNLFPPRGRTKWKL